MTKLIGLDTSTTCIGWSVFTDGEYTVSGTFSEKNSVDVHFRLKRLGLKLLDMLDTEHPDIIVIESTASTRNADTQRKLTLMLGVAYAWSIKNNTDYVMLTPPVWRSLISKEKKGRKREELKAWSIKTVKNLFGKKVSDDEADAILIGQAWINKLKD